MKHYSSYFENEQECIKSILEIHNGGKDIDCDPMYFKGNFYKNGVNKPRYRFDINPQQGADCVKGDARALPLNEGTLSSIILDPPFMICTRQSQREFYSSKTHSYYEGNDDLADNYKKLLAEAHRVLKKDGICIFKCQDYTDSKTLMTHCCVWQWAQEMGFYAKDLAILNIPKHKVYNGNTKQRHLRKVHTYFWVFVKR
ncbi:MAG: hypothetical protein NC131_00965 [Roseburia sp.]|nr:hypothetical protein [Roseburia sp.]